MLYLLHPAAIHFTIAFLLTGSLCELWGAFRRSESIERFGALVSAVGAASLLPTIVTGYLAANTAPMPPAARAALDRHEQAGLILLGLVLVALVWKAWHRGTLPREQAPLYAVLLVAIVAAVVWGAWLGGGLVYREGVGVSAPSAPASGARLTPPADVPPPRSPRSAPAAAG